MKLSEKEKRKKSLSNYSKYTGIAIQMAVIISVGVYGGIKLDELLSLSIPVFTILFSMLSVALAIYYVIKDLLKK